MPNRATLTLRRAAGLSNVHGSMSQLPTAEQSTPPAASSDVPVVEPGFEIKAQAFWEKNRSVILTLCVAVLVVIVAKEGWGYIAAAREKEVQAEYAKIATQPEKLAAFAESHAGHALAGLAYLQLADQKFSGGQFKDAAGFYAKAGAALRNDLLIGRARLGAAMSQLNGGDKVAASAALKAVAADAALLKDIRAEAQYHLAALAVVGGNASEAKLAIEEVAKLDQSGAWSQRATMLMAKLPVDSKPVDSAASAITFKP